MVLTVKVTAYGRDLSRVSHTSSAHSEVNKHLVECTSSVVTLVISTITDII